MEGPGRPGSVGVLVEQGAERVALVLCGLRPVGDEAHASVVGHGDAVPARGPYPEVSWVGEADDRPVGTQQLPGMAADRVEDVAQVGAAGELERDAVQRFALALPAVQVGDRQPELGGAGDLARDVDERGVRDVGLDRRVEGEPEVAEALAAADEGDVEDAGVEPRASGVAGAGDRRVRGLGEQRSEPGQAGRELRRSLDRDRPAVVGPDRAMPARAPVSDMTRSSDC